MAKIEQLKSCKNFSEAIKIVFGKTYQNGKIKKELIKFCMDNYGIDIENIINENRKNFCKNCGKQIRSGKKFCCQSCATTYNNVKRGKRSEETKKKISKSLIKKNADTHRNGEIRINGANKYARIHICENCGKEFFSIRKEQRFCGHKCAQSSDAVKNAIRKTIEKKVANGTHSGWRTRNITSYAEKFWENVLNNNGINFIREDFSTKKYFLDFLIEKNGKKLDLEIDGKQHKREDRKRHDIERDAFLAQNGYIVYRIQWN